MDTQQFWDEEIRGFPYVGKAAAIWVMRRDSGGTEAPIRQLFGWAFGTAKEDGLAHRPPLNNFLKALAGGKEALSQRPDQSALWVEPIMVNGEAHGCLGIWFDASEPWRESVFLWGQRLSARLRAVITQLDPLPVDDGNIHVKELPTLFPLLPAASVLPHTGLKPMVKRKAKLPGHPFPRPQIIPGIPGCVGVSDEMRRLGEMLGDVARSNVNVLLHGESGTGKEIIAKALHLNSLRHKGPFVGQNCAALPETLFESELFGHKAGAFTGASADKKGLLMSAHEGTFFLDEIGDMPMTLQIKILRVMQEKQVRSIGDLKSRSVDLRFISATHKDLEQEITKGHFRLDLYYRLKVVSLVIPPLRNRPEDVMPLFSFFLKKAGKDFTTMRISERAMRALQCWNWPGNVRELENEAYRLVAINPQLDCVKLGYLSPEIQKGKEGDFDPADLGTLRELDKANELLEKYLIRKAIAVTQGGKAAAARRLGLSRQGLYKKIQRYLPDLNPCVLRPL